jgi:hypothetical protein
MREAVMVEAPTGPAPKFEMPHLVAGDIVRLEFPEFETEVLTTYSHRAGDLMVFLKVCSTKRELRERKLLNVPISDLENEFVLITKHIKVSRWRDLEFFKGKQTA